MDDLLTALDTGASELLERALFGLPEAQLTAVVPAVQTIICRLRAVQAAAVREVDGRGIVRESGSVNASAWLRDRAHVSIGEARKVTALGALLAQRADLAAAVAAGAATAEQALTIGRIIDDLPDACDPAITDAVTAALLDHATRFEPTLLRKLGSRVLAHVAPEVADEQQRRRLETEERQAARDRLLHLSPDGSGRTRLNGILDTESAAVLRAALEPLMRPLPTTAGTDPRTAGMRRADALIDVCRLALRTGDLPIDGGQPTRLIITTDLDTLRTSLTTGSLNSGTLNSGTLNGGSLNGGSLNGGTLNSGTLDTGETLPAATVRRLACDARVLPAVLDSAGIPIDIGRSRRLYTGVARTAILIRDRGCAFPGCDRPPRWVEIHHIVAWADGGSTNRDNGVAMCKHHHVLIHDERWMVRTSFDLVGSCDPM